MAYESYYWRQIIKRDTKYLENKLKLSHKDIEMDVDKNFSEVEIRLMTLAYIIRKLADTHKLPDKTLRRKINVNMYARVKDFKRRSFADIEREYDLKIKTERSLSLREVANQIIHSYILQTIGSSRRAFKYLWFVSDRNRDGGLYEIKIKKLLKEFRFVADSHVTQIRSVYDSEKGDWIKTLD